MISEAQHRLGREADSLLTYPAGTKATHGDFHGGKVAVFLHGYTADAGYMRDLMQQFAGAGFEAFAFNYECFGGIDTAAKSLQELLRQFDRGGKLSGNRIVLVGHSMGGLVARTLVALEGGYKYVRKIITLGTPHLGTLRESKFLECLAQWGEGVSQALNPGAFSPTSRSAMQLMAADTPPSLINRLNQASPPDDVAFYSISGGYSHLEFGQSYWKNLVANRYLQKRLAQPNDGLVEESSSDLSREDFAPCAPHCIHDSSYATYVRTNHTYLVNNQAIALRAIEMAE